MFASMISPYEGSPCKYLPAPLSSVIESSRNGFSRLGRQGGRLDTSIGGAMTREMNVVVLGQMTATTAMTITTIRPRRMSLRSAYPLYRSAISCSVSLSFFRLLLFLLKGLSISLNVKSFRQTFIRENTRAKRPMSVEPLALGDPLRSIYRTGWLGDAHAEGLTERLGTLAKYKCSSSRNILLFLSTILFSGRLFGLHA